MIVQKQITLRIDFCKLVECLMRGSNEPQHSACALPKADPNKRFKPDAIGYQSLLSCCFQPVGMRSR
jgi:hypothetical protein